MALTSKVVDGKLEITKTGETNIVTLDLKEVTQKRAEAQTKLDHINIDRDAAIAEVAVWDERIAAFEK